MVRRDGYVKVLYFAQPKLAEPKGSSTDTKAPTKAVVNTGAGTVMGTANYMSPEQAQGLVSFTGRSNEAIEQSERLSANRTEGLHPIIFLK